MRASVAVSTLLVASSSTSMREARSSARAMHSSWRCPTDRLLPPSLMGASSPPGRERTVAARPACAAAAKPAGGQKSGGGAQEQAKKRTVLARPACRDRRPGGQTPGRRVGRPAADAIRVRAHVRGHTPKQQPRAAARLQVPAPGLACASASQMASSLAASPKGSRLERTVPLNMTGSCNDLGEGS